LIAAPQRKNTRLAYRFWGKTALGDPDSTHARWLSLVDHCTDVAMVFRELCKRNGPRRSLQCSADRPLSEVDFDRLAVLALLHDLGKCNRGFQARFDPGARDTAGHLREVLPLLHDRDLAGAFTTAVDFDTIGCWFADTDSAAAYFHALLAHHGRPHPAPSSEAETDRTARHWRATDAIDPFTGIRELVAAARETFPRAFAEGGAPLPPSPRFQHRFAGLLMLADWLGSHSEGFFPFEHTASSRQAFAAQAAPRALRCVGLDTEPERERLRADTRGFHGVFGFAPRALQQALAQPRDAQTVVVESATGSGKTEAALSQFLEQFRRGEVDSLYFALPTRVAARELYARVLDFARRAFGDEHPPVLLAVPGYAAVDGEPPDRLLPDADHLYNDNISDRMRERTWSAERPKRFLAAPIAVGTIDQALLSVLQTPHAHLRSVCLDRSLLVVDEVHASDTYVHHLLRALLAHHRRVGGRALLLSATLGAGARAELLTPPERAADVPAFHQCVATPYPALSSETRRPVGLDDSQDNSLDKQVAIEALAELEDPRALLPQLREAVAAQARVLVVMNTVDRAVALQRATEADPALQDATFRCHGVPCPHHGRFARADREALDAAVSGRMGKAGSAGPLLLIGTQTLEQSLDIDADWLVTDLCPIDVLLQRIGRLHRHARDRPSGYCQARCTVLVPHDRTLKPYLDERGRTRGRAGLGRVYPDLRIARLTCEIVDAVGEIRLPRDNRHLVEHATHPEQLERFREGPWEAHRNELKGVEIAHGRAASSALIPDLPFDELGFGEFEETLRTRLGLGDRRLVLDPPCTSPFGNRLSAIAIPGWMTPEGAEGETPEGAVEPVEDGLRFSYGGRAYRYTRYGLEQDNAA